MKISPFIKLSKLGIAVFIAAIFFTACTKNTDPTGDSEGILKDSATINGIFRVDSSLNADNYVDVLVDVRFGGHFDIKSDSVNGYSFKKSGTVGTGLNTIRLYASGKPIATGTNTFHISYGVSSSSFNITVFNSGVGTALYTLGGSPGNCSVTSINGNYITGQAMTAANTVQTTVNVTGIGTYIITGIIINGVSFNASGAFINPGLQSIILKASGTPTTAGLFSYPVTNSTTTCSFPLTYTTSITNATFGLSGSPNNCTGAVISGTYTAGTALIALNTAQVYVNVLSPGVYSIATNTVNGIGFSASGTFNITGLQQIILTGTGTPTSAGNFMLPVSGGGNICNIAVVCN